MGTMRDPKWWSEQHGGTWQRMKAALKRDWEQTKADVHVEGARDLGQNVADTVKQAAGSQPIPPAKFPTVNATDGKPAATADAKPSNGLVGRHMWNDDVEAAHRYGVGAREQYAQTFSKWDDRLESKLKEEWTDLSTGKTWDETKEAVRHGWERARDAV